MEDHTLIRRLKRGDPGALETAITSYGAYVATVIRNQLGRFATPEDVEELSSDAFVSLWKNRSTLKTERLRGWLGATARNCARDFLRKQSLLTVNIDDCITFAEDGAQSLLAKEERKRIVGEALLSLGAEDREIFLRYYFYGQSTAQIAEQMMLNQNTMKSRLARGRAKLKEVLKQGGYPCEN